MGWREAVLIGLLYRRLVDKDLAGRIDLQDLDLYVLNTGGVG